MTLGSIIGLILCSFAFLGNCSFTCFGIEFNSSSVCNKNGSCIGYDSCSCFKGYSGKECELFECKTEEDSFFGTDSAEFFSCASYMNFTRKSTNIVCNNKGTCPSPNGTCICQNDYFGVGCSEKIHLKAVQLLFEPTYRNEISINYSIDIETLNRFSLVFSKGRSINLMSYFDCSILIINSSIILGEGARCWFDYDSSSTNSNSTSNLLIESISSDYFNFLVENISNLSLRTITNESEVLIIEIESLDDEINNEWIKYVIIASSVGGGIVILFLVLVLCLAIVILALWCFILNQTKKLKKFSEIDGIEILLEEQKAEKKNEKGESESANLRINKKLFEVKFEEIEVGKKIGAGGSNSVVFVGKWKGEKIAFKCFKDDDLYNDKKRFAQFEKEVEILASLLHPHILRFYGACLKRPRIGFIMEYCKNGDLQSFLESHISIPLIRRVSFTEEIASALKHCHSIKICHRDVKSKNGKNIFKKINFYNSFGNKK